MNIWIAIRQVLEVLRGIVHANWVEPATITADLADRFRNEGAL